MRKSGKQASHLLAGAPFPRRAFIRDAGIGLLAFVAGGHKWLLTPAEARAADLPLRVLEAPQARALEAFGETMVPGSAAAGLVHFEQSLRPPERSRLAQDVIQRRDDRRDAGRPQLGIG